MVCSSYCSRMVDVCSAGKAGGELDLVPPPPPPIPPNVKPEVLISPKYSITTRSGTGTNGRRIQLLANHFKVTVKAPDAVFYQYSVCLSHVILLLWSLMCSVPILMAFYCRFILLLKTREPLKARELEENWLTGFFKHILPN